MSRILQSTPIALARCTRCGGYVLAGQVGGLKVAADPEPLGVEAYRQALIAGVTTYRLVEQGGRPWKLDSDVPHVPSGRKRLAAHDCGCIARDAVGVEVVPEGPRSAPATPGSRPAGHLPPAARAGASDPTASSSATSAPPPPAGHASPRRSDLAQTGLGAPEAVPRVPGHPNTPHRPPVTSGASDLRHVWPPSPTAPAENPGAEPPGRTAPAATRRSAATASPASTGSAGSVSTAGAWTRPTSGSYAGPTASGAGRRPRSSPGADPGLWPWRCSGCGALIAPGQPVSAIEYGSKLIWAIHEECNA